VIGLGNVVMSDDGLGMHALARLRARLAPHSDVTLVEGGTGGSCCSLTSSTRSAQSSSTQSTPCMAGSAGAPRRTAGRDIPRRRAPAVAAALDPLVDVVTVDLSDA
jgi:hypothetical protein